jgi:murein DD-endopeptidase MepM/ murein hydrolase activator NlpD
MNLYTIVFVVFLTTSHAVFPGTNCSEDTVCIKAANKEGGIALSVIIKRRAPITVDLSITMKNAKVRWLRKSSETYNKNGEYPLAMIQPIDRSKGWNYNYRYYYQRGSLYAKHDSSYVYLLPVKTNLPVKVTQGFGGQFSHQSYDYFAIDLDIPTGTPILAARPGLVVAVKEDSNKGGPYLKFAKYGNYITVLHEDLTIASYYHLKQNGASVNEGQRVKRGQVIGFSGNTGFSTVPHLHFVIQSTKNGKEKRSHAFKMKSGNKILNSFKGGDFIKP